jgi:hypothetical protein
MNNEFYFEDVVEINDLIPKKYQDHLSYSIMQPKFPWYFVREISAPYGAWKNNDLNKYHCEINDYSVSGFVHELWSKGNIESSYFDIFSPILYFLEDASNLEIKDLIEFRLNLFNRNKNIVPHHIPHIDVKTDDEKIYTALYYVNDSDGDTHFFKEFYDPSIKRFINGYGPDIFNLQTRVTPQKGKMILFDSRRYHASSYPEETPERIVLNITFTVK